MLNLERPSMWGRDQRPMTTITTCTKFRLKKTMVVDIHWSLALPL